MRGSVVLRGMKCTSFSSYITLATSIDGVKILRENRKISRRYHPPRIWWELDFSPADKRFIPKGRALALDFRGQR